MILAALNRVLRRLNCPWSLWHFHGQFILIRDEPGSLTPVIVAQEIKRGLYDFKPQAGETVVDLGAHVGLFCIPYAKAYPDVQFVAYEPNPRNYANLVKNIYVNQAWNVKAINAGLAPTQCNLATHTPQAWNTGSTTTQPTTEPGVQGVTLAAIRAEHQPSVMKVDIEGAEYTSTPINGLAGLRVLLMEIHGDRGNPEPILTEARKAESYRLQVISHPDAALHIKDTFPPKTSLR